MSSDEEEGDRDPFEYEKKVICVHETAGEAGALKLTPIHPHRPVPFWVPKSVIHDDSEVYIKGGEGKLVVFNWYAQTQGWNRAKVPLKLKPKKI